MKDQPHCFNDLLHDALVDVRHRKADILLYSTTMTGKVCTILHASPFKHSQEGEYHRSASQSAQRSVLAESLSAPRAPPRSAPRCVAGCTSEEATTHDLRHTREMRAIACLPLLENVRDFLKDLLRDVRQQRSGPCEKCAPWEKSTIPSKISCVMGSTGSSTFCFPTSSEKRCWLKSMISSRISFVMCGTGTSTSNSSGWSFVLGIFHHLPLLGREKRLTVLVRPASRSVHIRHFLSSTLQNSDVKLELFFLFGNVCFTHCVCNLMMNVKWDREARLQLGDACTNWPPPGTRQRRHLPQKSSLPPAHRRLQQRQHCLQPRAKLTKRRTPSVPRQVLRDFFFRQRHQKSTTCSTRNF